MPSIVLASIPRGHMTAERRFEMDLNRGSPHNVRRDQVQWVAGIGKAAGRAEVRASGRTITYSRVAILQFPGAASKLRLCRSLTHRTSVSLWSPLLHWVRVSSGPPGAGGEMRYWGLIPQARGRWRPHTHPAQT